MTSLECLRMKEKYENVKSQVQNAIGYFDGCSSSILETSNFLKDLIIDGKTFDDDKILNDNDKLNNAKSNLQSIISECNEKINYYDRLYKEALNRERTAALDATEKDEETTVINKPIRSNSIYTINVRE